MSARDRLWRASARARGRASLPDSLLCGTLPVYLASRLGPFAIYRLFGFAAHLTELFLLARLLPHRSLLGSVALHNLCALAAAFGWGALEPVRERVRRLGNPAEGAALAAPILSWTIAIGALLCGASAIGVWRSSGDVPALYAAALILRLALELATRALQIPIAARRRVFRPPAFLLARPLVAPLVLLFGFELLGARALPLSVAGAALAQSGVTALYTLRCLRRNRIPAPRPKLSRLLQLREAPLRAMLSAGLAAALPLASSLLICALLAQAASLESQRGRLLALHALVPLFFVAAGWTQLFYVDLHWLARPWRAAMLARFETALERAAPLVGLALVPWCALVARLVTHSHALGWTLACAPLLAAQAWLAALQLGLFVRGRASPLAWSGVIQSIGVLAAAAIVSRLLPLRGPGICLLCAAVQLTIALGLRRVRARSSLEPPLPQRGTSLHGEGPAELLPLDAWTLALARLREPLCTIALTAPVLSGARLTGLVARIEAIAGRPHVVTRTSPSALLFWVPASRAPSRAALLAAGAGLIQRLTVSSISPNGIEALAALRASGLLPTRAAIAPAAERIDLARGHCPASIRALPFAQRRRVLLAAERAARGLRRIPAALPCRPAADCEGGVLTGIHLLPKTPITTSI